MLQLLLSISVVVIVAINFLSEYGTLAAAIATELTGAPLSLRVMVHQNHHKKTFVLRELVLAPTLLSNCSLLVPPSAGTPGL